jgi:aerobic-type carbon monoxide dehydrogenase small subunit (CoxS/CutS family)
MLSQIESGRSVRSIKVLSKNRQGLKVLAAAFLEHRVLPARWKTMASMLILQTLETGKIIPLTARP